MSNDTNRLERAPGRLARLAMLVCLAALAAAVCVAVPAQAVVGPLWDVRASWGDTNLPPGGEGQFEVRVRNVGDAPSSFAQSLVVEDKLPAGVVAKRIHWTYLLPNKDVSLANLCTGKSTGTVTCSSAKANAEQLSVLEYLSQPFPQAHWGYLPPIYIDVEVGEGVPETAANLATVSGGGASQPFSDEDQVPFGSTPAPFDVRQGSLLGGNFTAAYPFGEPLRQAGARPFETRVNFEMDQHSAIGADGTRYILPSGLVKTVEATLPRGMIGNPEALPKCDPVDFANLSNVTETASCPADTQAGYIGLTLQGGNVDFGQGSGETFFTKFPIFNMQPPKGVIADFAFNAAGFVQAHIYFTLDPAQNYAIKSVSPNINDSYPVRSAEVTFWGVPGDPAHDPFRWDPVKGEGRPVRRADPTVDDQPDGLRRRKRRFSHQRRVLRTPRRIQPGTGIPRPDERDRLRRSALPLRTGHLIAADRPHAGARPAST